MGMIGCSAFEFALLALDVTSFLASLSRDVFILFNAAMLGGGRMLLVKKSNMVVVNVTCLSL